MTSETRQNRQSVRIYEVSPRDGLQNVAEILPVETKLNLVQGLVDAGVKDIEVSSFVRPSWIPQLADAAEVVARLPLRTDVRFWGLVPNQRGLERALGAGLRHVATFMSASETHNRKNLNRTRLESIATLRDVIGMAKDEGGHVRSYISTAFGCPYEGVVTATAAEELTTSLLDAGADVVVLGDTTGMGNPHQVAEMIAHLEKAGVPLEQLALHLHDTRGTALANALAGWQAGIRTFDGSVAGLGGCPYAPGASGNAATEDLVHMFEAMGVATGIDLNALANVGHLRADALQRPLPGRYHRFHAGTLPKDEQEAEPARLDDDATQSA